MKRFFNRVKPFFYCLFICVFLSVFVISDNVYGDSNAGSIQPGSGGGGGGSGGGHDRNIIAFGYRISLVYNSTKDGHTAGTRVSGTKSVDYWMISHYNFEGNGQEYGFGALINNNNNWTWNDKGEAHFCYPSNAPGVTNRKFTKQEVSAGKTGTISCSSFLSNDNDNNRIDTLTGVTTNFARSKYGGDDGYERTGNYIAQIASTNLKTIFDKDQSQYSSYEYNTINTFLVNCGFNKNPDAKTNINEAVRQDVTLQLEPVSAIRDGSGQQTDDRNHNWTNVYVGTSAEQSLSGMMADDDNWAYNKVTYLHPIIFAQRNNKDKANNIYTKAGIAISDSFSNDNVTRANSKSASSPLAVALYYLGDYFGSNNCDADLVSALKANNSTSYNSLVNNYKASYPALSKLSFNDFKMIYSGKYDSASCSPSCEDEANAIYKNCYGKSCSYMGKTNYSSAVSASVNNLSKYDATNENNVKLYLATNSSPTSDGFFCVDYGCDKMVEDASITWSASIGYPNSVYEKYITWLLSYLPTKYPGTNTTLIATSNWQDIGLSGPQCDSLPPSPPPPTPNANCTGSVTFSDTSDLDIIKQNVAYETVNGKKAASALMNVGNTTCKYVCQETVTFTLPTRPSTIKAGKVFKWGSSTNINSEEFGIMNVTEKCYIKPTVKKEVGTRRVKNKKTGKWEDETYTKGYTINCAGTHTLHNSDFEDKFTGTKVKLYFNEPSDSSLKVNGVELKVVKDTVSTTGSVSCSTALFSSKDSAKNGCSNSITFTGKYLLNYDDKLKWESSKIDSSLITKNNVDVSKSSWYYEIGYGLPTAFTTPNFTVEDSNPNYLYANISNIGRTQNSNHHFDKLVSSITGSSTLKYYCGFEIKNELFGDDCEYDSNGNLKPGSPDYCDLKEDDQINPGLDKEPVRGIDVVFRTIDLINKKDNIASQIDRAFPGRLGKIDNNGRQKGHNWSNLDIDPAVNDTKIADILDDTVYSKAKPQYHIELTVAKIYDIRKMNREAKSATPKLDPFSEMTIYNYSDDSHMSPGNTGYYCAEGTDVNGEKHKYCASHFVSILKEKYGLTGSCIDGHPYTQSRAVYYKNNGCTS